MRHRAPIICLATGLLAAVVTANAGDISGLSPHLPPTVRPDYQIFLGNDFLVPGTNDDFRTQQLITTARFNDRWLATLDISIFTNNNPLAAPPERIDTLSFSLGYDFVQNITATERTIVTAGVGIRGVGNFEGGRIQNGFHRLVASDLSTLPYSMTRRSDATIWSLAERYRLVRDATESGLFDGWNLGYWVRGGALVTADGQVDAVAGLYAVASKSHYDVWLGLRHDWRSGYDTDEVLQATADQEQNIAVAWGVRFGSVVLESVHRLDGLASYGQLSFISTAETRKNRRSPNSKADLQFGLHLPHVLFQIAARYHYNLLIPETSAWRESYLVDVRAGEPQYGNDVTRFVETYQATLGIEWSRPFSERSDWLRFYTNFSAGWRSEKLLGNASLFDEESAAIDRGVFVAGLGIEVFATPLGNRWQHSLRFGATGWKPSSSATVTVGGIPSTIHQAGAVIVAAWTIDYR